MPWVLHYESQMNQLGVWGKIAGVLKLTLGYNPMKGLPELHVAACFMNGKKPSGMIGSRGKFNRGHCQSCFIVARCRRRSTSSSDLERIKSMVVELRGPYWNKSGQGH